MRPKVLIAMPQYGNTAHIGAMHSAVSWPTKGAVDVAGFSDMGSSLLPHCFNGLLVAGLNMRDREGLTHFAMLHSDITAGHGWIDILWERMATLKLGAISAIVPIKDQTDDRTSTAIGSRSDEWSDPPFVRMRDRGENGGTLVSDSFQGDSVLLINTGCMLLDLRFPFWDSFAFGFKTRIIVRDGLHVAQIQPEDWIMSRELDAAGIRYAATWDVPIKHHGGATWGNQWTP